ncbi:ComEC/Rec2 family competence protein [Paenibacillus sp. NPDC056579]|uniref:ComEC/Rec2 family competence protein n=1 Tax=Paenibacillus sp. NPDC056579 TaxID=3345871 RepID=UPI003677DD84
MRRTKLLATASAALLLTVWLTSGCGSVPATTPGGTASTPSDHAEGQDASGRLEPMMTPKRYEGLLTVRYLNLKHEKPEGDCIVIQSPDGKTMIIDAGIPEVGPQVVDALTKLGIQKIDIAVNTHPHTDHIGGFDSVFKKVPVDRFYMVDAKASIWASYRNAMSQVQLKNIKTEFLQEGDTFVLGPQVHVQILNPRKGELPGAIKTFELDEVNNASMVLKLTYKDTSFLFTGDIHREREMELIERYGDKLKADFMDAPHHGISTSSSQSWLSAVSPRIAVISYDHFNTFKQLLNYQKNNIQTYVTGFHGQVLLTSDGKKLNVFTEKDYPDFKK